MELAIQILSLATALISLAGAVVALLPKARGDAWVKKRSLKLSGSSRALIIAY